jgi:hypothetical protein
MTTRIRLIGVAVALAAIPMLWLGAPAYGSSETTGCEHLQEALG